LKFKHNSLQYLENTRRDQGTPRCQVQTKTKNLIVDDRVLKSKAVYGP